MSLESRFLGLHLRGISAGISPEQSKNMLKGPARFKEDRLCEDRYKGARRARRPAAPGGCRIASSGGLEYVVNACYRILIVYSFTNNVTSHVCFLIPYVFMLDYMLNL